jgi:hypothetical protein
MSVIREEVRTATAQYGAEQDVLRSVWGGAV